MASLVSTSSNNVNFKYLQNNLNQLQSSLDKIKNYINSLQPTNITSTNVNNTTDIVTFNFGRSQVTINVPIVIESIENPPAPGTTTPFYTYIPGVEVSSANISITLSSGKKITIIENGNNTVTITLPNGTSTTKTQNITNEAI